MADYTRIGFEDEVPDSSPVKYEIIDDDLGTVAANATIAPVTAITAGTPFNSTNMTLMEDGIFNAQAAADDAQDTADAAAITNTRAEYLYALRDIPIDLRLNGSTPLTTSDKAPFRVPAKLNGGSLIAIAAMCVGASSSGTVTLTVKKRTGAGAWATMLSVDITMGVGITDSLLAAVQPQVGGNNSLLTADQILVEVSGAGTGVTYCMAELTVRPAA